MNDLDRLVDIYGHLEKDLQECMAAHCGHICARCAVTCCRPWFCAETLESAFLKLVRERFAPLSDWDTAVGWLTPTGCSLTAGRPPVCYEFLCSRLVAAQPTVSHKTALQKLGMVMTDAGRSARGRRHLVELDDLNRINSHRLLARMAAARDTLGRLRRFWQGGLVSGL